MLSVKPWRAEAVAQFCAALLVCIGLGVLVSGILQHLRVSGFKQLDDFGNLFVGTFSFQGVAWVLGFIFLKHHQVSCAAALGFHGPRLKRALLLALLVVAIILPVAWQIGRAHV